MKTVRELIQALLINGNLDDEVTVEVVVVDKHDGESCFQTHLPKYVYHMDDGETVIECHEH